MDQCKPLVGGAFEKLKLASSTTPKLYGGLVIAFAARAYTRCLFISTGAVLFVTPPNTSHKRCLH
jgi:hypothetical protein